MPSYFVISLDFELAWGMPTSKACGSYRANILGGRDAIPHILALAHNYGIRGSWATVGFLFFEDKDELMSALPAIRPRYRVDNISSYSRLADIGPNEKADPLHFGRSLVREILACPGQEIAGHTFSHYCCLEDDDNGEAFGADLAAAEHAAGKLGIRLKSLVFPRNQVRESYLPICLKAGYLAYRGTPDADLHKSRPRGEETIALRLKRSADSYWPLHKSATEPVIVKIPELTDVRSSRYLRPVTPFASLSTLQLRRIKNEMTQAAKSNGTYHLWWHPHNFGRNTDANLIVLEKIFSHYRRLASEYGMISATMESVATAVRDTDNLPRPDREPATCDRVQ